MMGKKPERVLSNSWLVSSTTGTIREIGRPMVGHMISATD